MLMETSNPNAMRRMIIGGMVLAPYLPVSNLLFVVGFDIAERVMYTPSIGLGLVVGYALHCQRWALGLGCRAWVPVLVLSGVEA